MTCYCHSAHGVYHRCHWHRENAGHLEEWWVDADNCRYCLADELAQLEARVEIARDRWRKAMNPRLVISETQSPALDGAPREGLISPAPVLNDPHATT